jgi:hypothetical protein
MAQFQFRAGNKWIDGTHNRSVIQGLFGPGQEDVSRTEPFTFEVAHPAVLIGDSNGPAAVGFPRTLSLDASPPGWPTSRPLAA